MYNLPIAAILATEAMDRELNGGRADAPVVPNSEPARSALRVRHVRLRMATGLRRAAAVIEPA